MFLIKIFNLWIWERDISTVPMPLSRLRTPCVFVSDSLVKEVQSVRRCLDVRPIFHIPHPSHHDTLESHFTANSGLWKCQVSPTVPMRRQSVVRVAM